MKTLSIAYESIYAAFIQLPYWIRSLLMGAMAILLVTLLSVLAFQMYPRLPVAVWWAIGISLVSLSVLWFVLHDIPWYRHRRAVRSHATDTAWIDFEADAKAVATMAGVARRTSKTVRKSPIYKGMKDPLYQLPRFMLIGNADADQDGLLRSASAFSPFPAPAVDVVSSEQYWQWWNFKDLIAIETDFRFVCDSEDRLFRGRWRRALELLYEQRPKLPLNGVVLCVAAGTLCGEPDMLREYALRSRRLVNEIVIGLQLQIPLYIVITRCDELKGFVGFFGNQPRELLEQVLGYRANPNGDLDAPASAGRAGEVFADIVSRLEALRLGLLRENTNPLKRQGVFSFVEEFTGLKPGLQQFFRVLFEEHPIKPAPQWRGLYFAGTGLHSAFVKDLFERFLPVEQPLAHSIAAVSEKNPGHGNER